MRLGIRFHGRKNCHLSPKIGSYPNSCTYMQYIAFLGFRDFYKHIQGYEELTSLRIRGNELVKRVDCLTESIQQLILLKYQLKLPPSQCNKKEGNHCGEHAYS